MHDLVRAGIVRGSFMQDLTPGQIHKIKQIKLLILDVDGVLTDGRLYFDNQGDEYKCFHARDGQAKDA